MCTCNNFNDTCNFYYNIGNDNSRTLQFFYTIPCASVNVSIHVAFIRNSSDAARYAFGKLQQQGLDEFVLDWNSHRIRQSKMAEAPGGKPNVLYNFPSLKGIHTTFIVKYNLNTGCRNYLCSVNEEQITLLHQYSEVPVLVDKEFVDLVDALTLHHNLPTPCNFHNALELYFSLVVNFILKEILQ